ncbi:MAG: glutathione S-transferase, partial [Cyanobacteriota bacterium]|nr:glutathione S-transferase [Cyanobacteriota bacterium]
LEQRPTYLGTQSDFHTHAHDLPPQMGGCYASGSPQQRRLAAAIDAGPWPLLLPDPETSAPPRADSARQAMARVCRHRAPLMARMAAASGATPEDVDGALRAALSHLQAGTDAPATPPAGTARALRYLRDRISVPRDMDLHAARQLRAALEQVACRDPAGPLQGPALPLQHRRDQDPAPFVKAE